MEIGFISHGYISTSNLSLIHQGCGGGTCPQYAADISNADFRQYWINQALVGLNAGTYKGIWIDDVNLQALQVSDGNSNLVAPYDP